MLCYVCYVRQFVGVFSGILQAFYISFSYMYQASEACFLGWATEGEESRVLQVPSMKIDRQKYTQKSSCAFLCVGHRSPERTSVNQDI